jgi:hypothetical protein
MKRFLSLALPERRRSRAPQKYQTVRCLGLTWAKQWPTAPAFPAARYAAVHNTKSQWLEGRRGRGRGDFLLPLRPLQLPLSVAASVTPALTLGNSLPLPPTPAPHACNAITIAAHMHQKQLSSRQTCPVLKLYGRELRLILAGELTSTTEVDII